MKEKSIDFNKMSIFPIISHINRWRQLKTWPPTALICDTAKTMVSAPHLQQTATSL